MALFIALLVLVAIFIGLGFVVKWLFIVAAIVAVIALISFVVGRSRA